MANITFTIPDDKLQRIIDAMKGLYPIPMINVGTEEAPILEPEFTDGQWAKERTRQWIRDQVARYEQATAQDAIHYSPDDSIIT